MFKISFLFCCWLKILTVEDFLELQLQHYLLLYLFWNSSDFLSGIGGREECGNWGINSWLWIYQAILRKKFHTDETKNHMTRINRPICLFTTFCILAQQSLPSLQLGSIGKRLLQLPFIFLYVYGPSNIYTLYTAACLLLSYWLDFSIS